MAVTRLAISRVEDTGILSSRSLSFPPNTTPLTAKVVFFSTHVLEVAEKLCHKIAIIKHGRLVKSGPTAELVGDSSLEDVFLELEGDK